MIQNKEIIAAIATPPGRGAIGIIRMSGEGAIDVLKKVWKSEGQSVDKFATHRLYLGNIIDLSTGRTIDQVLACLMKAPNSYTGEDVVEVSCHGGGEVLKLILGSVLAAGARVAEPGEFTRRAFLNGKMDLAQAEAVANLIDSRSSTSARMASEQLEGRLSGIILKMRERLTNLTAFVEATIDFPEEDIQFIKGSDVLQGLKSIREEMRRLIDSYDRGRIIREGVKVVIAGPPNAGKSSLFNALLGHDRAIVHHVPGTTRDTIEEEAILGDLLFRFVDTAGIREAEEEVEELGVSRSKKALNSAEAVLLVVDGHEFVGVDAGFEGELKIVKHVVVVVNKGDLGTTVSNEELKARFGDRKICNISANTGDGVEELIETLIKEMIGKVDLQEEGITITSARHFDLLQRSLAALSEASKSIECGESAEFITVHLKKGLDHLGEIVGEVTNEEILNKIFSTFCIGK